MDLSRKRQASVPDSALTKGIWIVAPGETLPSVTLIGSSNFTRRSHDLDLESTCVLITRDPKLQSALSTELAQLRSPASPTSADDITEFLAAGGVTRSWAVKFWVALAEGKLWYAIPLLYFYVLVMRNYLNFFNRI